MRFRARFCSLTPAIAGMVEAVQHFFRNDLNGNAKAVDIAASNSVRRTELEFAPWICGIK